MSALRRSATERHLPVFSWTAQSCLLRGRLFWPQASFPYLTENLPPTLLNKAISSTAKTDRFYGLDQWLLVTLSYLLRVSC